MSYDTTVNDALDPPETHLPQHSRGSAQLWKMMAVVAFAGFVAALALGGWMLLR